jgi:hypothetical protein
MRTYACQYAMWSIPPVFRDDVHVISDQIALCLGAMRCEDSQAFAPTVEPCLSLYQAPHVLIATADTLGWTPEVERARDVRVASHAHDALDCRHDTPT